MSGDEWMSRPEAMGHTPQQQHLGQRRGSRGEEDRGQVRWQLYGCAGVGSDRRRQLPQLPRAQEAMFKKPGKVLPPSHTPPPAPHLCCEQQAALSPSSSGGGMMDKRDSGQPQRLAQQRQVQRTAVVKAALLLAVALVTGLHLGAAHSRSMQGLGLRRHLTEAQPRGDGLTPLATSVGGSGGSSAVTGTTTTLGGVALEELEQRQELAANVSFYSGTQKTLAFQVCNGFTNQRLAFLSGAQHGIVWTSHALGARLGAVLCSCIVCAAWCPGQRTLALCAGMILAIELNRTMVLPHLLLNGSQSSFAYITEGNGAVVEFG